MATDFDLTAREEEQLREAMPKIKTLLENNYEAADRLLDSPLTFLRKHFKIRLLDFIAKRKDATKSFEDSVRALFERFNKIFNECFACKLAALIILHGLLAKYNIALVLLSESVDKIVGILGDFFGGTSKQADEFLEYIEKQVKKLKPSSLALEFCRFIGACEPLDGSNIFVGVPNPSFPVNV